MEFAAVVFDFDGVLARTMEDNHRAWVKALASLVPDLGAEEYLLLEGLSPRSVAETLLVRRGVDPAKARSLAPELARIKDEAYHVNNRFTLYPGIPELLERSAARCPLALVTGAARARLERTLSPELRSFFRVLVTADDAVPCKPDPAPYRRAAERLGLPPERCLAVENAPLGVRSAKAAGMSCLAVCSTLGVEHLREADHIVADALGMADFIDRVLEDPA